MVEKKDMKIDIKQQDDGCFLVEVHTGWRKNKTMVAETVDSLIQKTNDEISKHYRGYSHAGKG